MKPLCYGIITHKLRLQGISIPTNVLFNRIHQFGTLLHMLALFRFEHKTIVVRFMMPEKLVCKYVQCGNSLAVGDGFWVSWGWDTSVVTGASFILQQLEDWVEE